MSRRTWLAEWGGWRNTLIPTNPSIPLARVMAALLPKIFGAHGFASKSMWDEGSAILFSHGAEDFTLALARLDILPFFWITCWIAFSCTRWISGDASAAVLAVFLVSMTPAVLAHAGLATTDLALTAMLLAAIYSGWCWLESPGWKRAAIFGAAIDEVRKRNTTGHLTYLLGAVNTTGWPQFYVVALAVKTPLPILALGVLGLVLLFSRKRFGTRGWIMAAVVLGILIFSSFFTQIRIGGESRAAARPSGWRTFPNSAGWRRSRWRLRLR